jgi:hypothetical protein
MRLVPLYTSIRINDRSGSRSPGSSRGRRRSRSTSPARLRSGGAPGGGIGPVRFSVSPVRRGRSGSRSPGRRGRGGEDDDADIRPTPIDHEYDTRRLGPEPPAANNPRAKVPFAPAPRPLSPSARRDAGKRKERAVLRARAGGFVATRAPEGNKNIFAAFDHPRWDCIAVEFSLHPDLESAWFQPLNL